MKKTFSTLLLIFAFTIFFQTAYSQGFPYHLYDTRTMAELAELNAAAEKTQTVGKTQFAISANPFYSAVRLEYAGESRKLSERKLGFYKLWAAALGIKSSNTNYDPLDLIKTEYLFRECGKDYWITVQTPAANDFPKEMKKGDRITLYMMIVGGMKFDKEEWEYMYLTNSFKIYE